MIIILLLNVAFFLSVFYVFPIHDTITLNFLLICFEKKYFLYTVKSLYFVETFKGFKLYDDD